MIGSIQTAQTGMAIQEANVNASARRLAGVGNAGITSAVSSVIGSASSASSGSSASPSTAGNAEPQSAPYLPDVDFGSEMVNMTVAKSAYEANTKVVKVSDEMQQQAIDLVG